MIIRDSVRGGVLQTGERIWRGRESLQLAGACFLWRLDGPWLWCRAWALQASGWVQRGMGFATHVPRVSAFRAPVVHLSCECASGVRDPECCVSCIQRRARVVVVKDPCEWVSGQSWRDASWTRWG